MNHVIMWMHVIHKCSDKQNPTNSYRVKELLNISDCGVFALACTTELAHGGDPVIYE